MALPLTLRAQLTPPATASTSKSGRFFRRAVLLIALLLPTAQAAEVIEDSAEIESLAPGLSSALQEDESKSSLGNAASDHHTSVYYTMQANRERLNPKNFHGKLGFNFQIAPSIKNAVDYTALDFSYGFPFSWGWLEIMFAKQTTTFARVGHHAQHPAMLNSGLKTKNDIIMLGSGITMVADYPQMLLTSFGQKLYATASTYLIFLSYKDRDWGQT